MSQEKAKKPTPADADEMAERDAARQQDTERGRRDAKQAERQDHLEDIDDVLADIDTILEDQEVLVNFRQRGGQ